MQVTAAREAKMLQGLCADTLAKAYSFQAGKAQTAETSQCSFMTALSICSGEATPAAVGQTAAVTVNLNAVR